MADSGFRPAKYKKSKEGKQTPMIQVQHLREECMIALDRYAHEAQRTCELLDDIEGTTPTLDQLLSVSAQTQAEDNALQAYLLLRQHLFDAWNGTWCELDC